MAGRAEWGNVLLVADVAPTFTGAALLNRYSSGMLASELTADLTYGELARIVEENGEPFASLAQCDLYLRAANMLRRRVPEEHEQAGVRIRTRDLQVGIELARKARGMFLVAAQKPVSIVPPDCLR